MKEYGQKLAIPKLMLKPPDGRTITGLKRQKAELGSSAATMSDAQELGKMETDINVCGMFLPGVLEYAEDVPLRTAIDYCKTRCKVEDWPDSTNKLFLNRIVARHTEDESWALLFDVTFPLANGAWDPNNPTVAAFPSTSQPSKVATHVRLFYKETLIGLIGEGQPKADAVMKLCGRALAVYAAVDPLEFDSDILSTVHYWCVGSEFLEVIGADHLGPTHSAIFV